MGWFEKGRKREPRRLTLNDLAVVVKTNGIPCLLVGEFTTHFSPFRWGLGGSLVRDFDPWPCWAGWAYIRS